MFAHMAWLVREWGVLADWLDGHVARLARHVAIVVVAHAALRTAALRKPNIRWPRKPLRARVRAMIGASLRRTLNAPTVYERIIRIGQAIANLEGLIANALRRLARGLTRLRPIFPRGSSIALVQCACVPPLAFADTS